MLNLSNSIWNVIKTALEAKSAKYQCTLRILLAETLQIWSFPVEAINSPCAFFTEMQVRILQLPTRCKWCQSLFSFSMILKSAAPRSLWPALFCPISCKDTLIQGMFSGNPQGLWLFLRLQMSYASARAGESSAVELPSHCLWQNTRSLATAGSPGEKHFIHSNPLFVWRWIGRFLL